MITKNKIISSFVSIVISLGVYRLFPFHLSFPLSDNINFMLTAVAGFLLFFVLKNIEDISKFFFRHFILTVILRGVLEVFLLATMIDGF